MQDEIFIKITKFGKINFGTVKVNLCPVRLFRGKHAIRVPCIWDPCDLQQMSSCENFSTSIWPWRVTRQFSTKVTLRFITLKWTLFLLLCCCCYCVVAVVALVVVVVLLMLGSKGTNSLRRNLCRSSKSNTNAPLLRLKGNFFFTLSKIWPKLGF